MNICTNRQIDRFTNRQIDRFTSRQIDRLTNRQIDILIYVETDRKTGSQTDRSTDDRQINRWKKSKYIWTERTKRSVDKEERTFLVLFTSLAYLKSSVGWVFKTLLTKNARMSQK